MQREFFENLFRLYHKQLCMYAFRYVKDMDIAEDVVQDVFFDLWQRKYLDFDRNIKSYLFKATYSRCMNYLVSKHYKNNVRLEQDIKQDLYFISVLDNDDTLLKNELFEEIENKVNILPEYCRKIFIMRCDGNLKNREIADILGVSIKAVEKQITKALSLIREHLKSKDMLK